MMTAKELKRVQRLEIENRELRKQLEHYQDVNRQMIYEIVNLKTTLELVNLAVNGEDDET
jgi:hypothetical protein